MKRKFIFLELVFVFASAATAQTLNHSDNFSNWQKLTDNSAKKEKINSVYYRILHCTTIANTKIGNVMHPIGKIEVKVPEELNNSDGQLTGFINIAGQKNFLINDKIQIEKDTIQQFFLVSELEHIFRVELAIEFFYIDNIYLTIFDNDISEVYSEKDDEANKKENKKKEIALSDEKKNQIEITDKETRDIFDLIFGEGSSSDLSITEGDKQKAEYLFSELLKGSCEMAIVQGLSTLKPSLTNMAKKLFKTFSKCDTILKEGKYYESVRKAIAVKMKSPFTIRKQTGEW